VVVGVDGHFKDAAEAALELFVVAPPILAAAVFGEGEDGPVGQEVLPDVLLLAAAEEGRLHGPLPFLEVV